MVIEFAGMGNQSLWLNDLELACLLIPQVTKDVSRCLEKFRGFVSLVLLHQQLDDQHDRLLHRDVGIVGQWELTEQLFQRVLLSAIKWRGR